MEACEFEFSANNDHDFVSSFIPTLSHEGDVVRLMGLCHDITERKQIELEREKILAELEDKNGELERFTYTVSHDLKSPLVTINGFLGALRQDAAEGNTERLEADIEYISKAADKMGRLLDELLQLSRIGRMTNSPEKVPLTDLARQAADLVAGHITARGVEVTIEPGMPVVYGDRLRLLEIYQNLIENAVKFMGTQQASRVEIGARLDDRAALCWVRDNGIGIAPIYHEKVFGLFNRLDATTEGTGIGLALVKRIVDVHGGQIWIDSEGEEQGSTFLFTLPPSPTQIA